MLFNLKKEENSDMCYEKDEPWRHCAQWEKQSQMDKYCMIPLMWSTKESNSQKQKEEWWLSAAEGRGVGVTV